ncbi:hypothetical protein CLOSTHATH_06420 [Hungatella hathewayi DSM 13479]|uniref:Uncharacterized protein n=1 Tax=Hungatella hathewayi DSM 13479 TaxID=566550 RepID=D3AS15_9FIRM|nr:hypothetical protein CLOSTHATH_06420 [Hungatella hathewayi DSM 13479]
MSSSCFLYCIYGIIILYVYNTTILLLVLYLFLANSVRFKGRRGYGGGRM